LISKLVSATLKATMMKASTLLFLLSLAIGQQQSPSSLVKAIEYLEEPVLVWQTQTDVILDGNGVYTSPDDYITVVSQANGNLNAYDTKTGQPLWQFVPPSNKDLPITCQGGVTFSIAGQDDYLIYSVTDDPNGIVSFTRVISLGLDGTLKWVSTPLEGAAAGSPLASFDGRYVFLTHNSNVNSVGHFSALDTLDASFLNPVFPLYSEFNKTNPFSPPGIHHNPAEGFYDGGQMNTNDIVVWAHAPNPLERRVGNGMTFVFQLPLGYAAPNQQASIARQADQDDGVTDLTEQNQSDMSRKIFWIILGANVKDWQSVSAPVLTNQGRSIYWSVTRSQFRAWVGQAGTNVARFNRGRTSSPEFERGSPRYAPSPNTPALSSSTTEPMIFAGTASEEFVKMNYLMDDDSALVRNTTSRVRARAHVSPDDKFVYFSEFAGIVHQASTDDLVDNWSVSETGALDGEFALTSDGTMLIVGDVTGRVFAYQVAKMPTPSPTLSPTLPPTDAQPVPTTGFRPSVAAPIPIPGLPTAKPTRSPIFQSMPTKPETPPAPPVQEESSATQTRLALALFALVGVFVLIV